MTPQISEFAFLGDVPPEVVDFASKMAQNLDKILIAAGPEVFVLDVIKQLWIDTQSYDGRKLVFFVTIGDIPVDRDGQPDFETCLHRIGRMGRFGRKGNGISL